MEGIVAAFRRCKEKHRVVFDDGVRELLRHRCCCCPCSHTYRAAQRVEWLRWAEARHSLQFWDAAAEAWIQASYVQPTQAQRARMLAAAAEQRLLRQWERWLQAQAEASRSQSRQSQWEQFMAGSRAGTASDALRLGLSTAAGEERSQSEDEAPSTARPDSADDFASVATDVLTDDGGARRRSRRQSRRRRASTVERSQSPMASQRPMSGGGQSTRGMVREEEEAEEAEHADDEGDEFGDLLEDDEMEGAVTDGENEEEKAEAVPVTDWQDGGEEAGATEQQMQQQIYEQQPQQPQEQQVWQLSDTWSAWFDGTCQAWVYYNSATGQSQWEAPELPAAAPPAAAHARPYTGSARLAVETSSVMWGSVWPQFTSGWRGADKRRVAATVRVGLWPVCMRVCT